MHGPNRPGRVDVDDATSGAWAGTALVMAIAETEATKARPLARAIEGAAALDPAAKAAAKAVRGALDPGPVKDALSGTWLGHALHPLLTDAVIGTWLSALVLDATGGDAGAAERLIAAGVVCAVPTAVTGATDWADAEPVGDGVRRVGAVHAVGNLAALGLQIASLAARRRGARHRGVALSLAAGGLLGVTGYLGGHLSFSRGVGVDQTVFDAGPEDWTDAAAAAEIDSEPTAIVVGDTPVLLVRLGGSVMAVHDRCSHRGCSLSRGTLDGDTIQCACHGSRFNLRDGRVERGPASAPQPAFDARERDGRIELRRKPGAEGRR
jgi:nitrite reductase/ring-hydroxylating ferredoxin subunit/uncharacterized membrane protein